MSDFAVLIIDDHEIVRRGLKDLLQEAYDELLIAEAQGPEDYLEKLEERKWSLILLDVLVPELNVLDVLAQIRERDPDVPVLILTAIPEAEYAVSTLRAGANGYITKQHASEELLEAIRTVLSGEHYLSKGAMAALAADLRGSSTVAPHELLSKRELEVFCAIAHGKTIKQIAFDLSVSAKTVSTYVTRIKDKTGLENYVEITRYAMKNKLVQ